MNVKDWSQGELQGIVCMTGSKKAFGIYLGVEGRELEQLWKKGELKSPTQYLWSLSANDLMKLTFRLGSWRKAAEYLGVSDTTYKKRVMEKYGAAILPREGWEDEVEELLKKYGTIKFTARVLRVSEKEIRGWMERHGKSTLEVLGTPDSKYSADKGRRAELHAMAWRGDNVIEDLNVTQGTHASADFLDKQLCRVNVKSSREFKYKSQSRKGVRYWKFSTAGLDNCDTVLLVLYDKNGENPEFEIKKPSECGLLNTFYVNKSAS